MQNEESVLRSIFNAAKKIPRPNQNRSPERHRKERLTYGLLLVFYFSELGIYHIAHILFFAAWLATCFRARTSA